MDVLVYLGVGFIVGSAAGIGASQHLREKQMRQQQVYLEQVLQEANYNLDRNFDLRLEKSINHLQNEQRQQYHLYDQHLKEQESRLQSQIVTWQSDYQSYVQQELSISNDQQNKRLQEVIQSLQGDYENKLKKLVSDWKKSQNARLQEWERRLNIRLEDLNQQNNSKLQESLNLLQNQRGELVLEELGKVEKVYETRLQDQIHLLRQEYDRKLQEQVIGLTDRLNDKYNSWQNIFSVWEAKQDIKLQQSSKQVEENYQGRMGELIKSLQQEQQIQLKQTQAKLEANYQERLQASLNVLQTEYEEHIRQLIEQRSIVSSLSSNVTDTISHTIEGYQLAEDLPTDQLNSVNNSNIFNKSNNYKSNNSHSLDESSINAIVYGDSLADQLVNPTPLNWENIEPELNKSVNDQSFYLVKPDPIIHATNGTYVNGVNGVNNTNGKYYTNGTNGNNGIGINGNQVNNETAGYKKDGYNTPASFSLNVSEVAPIISDTGESTVLTPSLSSISRDENNNIDGDQDNRQLDYLDQDHLYPLEHTKSDQPDIFNHIPLILANGYENNVLLKSPELISHGTAHGNFLVNQQIDNVSKQLVDFPNIMEPADANTKLNNDSLNTLETPINTIERVNDNDYPLILLFTRLILFVGICGVVLDNVKKETEQEKQCDVTSLPIDLI